MATVSIPSQVQIFIIGCCLSAGRSPLMRVLKTLESKITQDLHLLHSPPSEWPANTSSSDSWSPLEDFSPPPAIYDSWSLVFFVVTIYFLLSSPSIHHHFVAFCLTYYSFCHRSRQPLNEFHGYTCLFWWLCAKLALFPTFCYHRIITEPRFAKLYNIVWLVIPTNQ